MSQPCRLWSWMLIAVATLSFDAVSGWAETYRSPLAMVVSPDGKTAYATDKTAGCIVVLDVLTNKKIADIPLPGEPNGLAITLDGKMLYVALRMANQVAMIDTATNGVVGRIDVGPWPVAVTVAEKTKRLFVCNRGNHTVSVVDLATGKQVKQIPVVRDPCCAAVTPDESRVVVANYMPLGPGTDPGLAAEVSILDTTSLEQVARVKLPAGSTAAGGVCCSPDGRWAYVVHSIGRFMLPVTQLDRGWVHTYALSIVDVSGGSPVVSLLLDNVASGAADPWAVAISPDGRRLWISHAGIHEISFVDIGRIHELLDGKLPPELAALKDGTADNVWTRISKDKNVAKGLADDLTALSIAGVIRRVGSGGNSPRGIALSPDGQRLYVTNYFSGTIGSLDATDGKLLATIPLGEQPSADAARRGEIYFHDATRCFQRWHSCATCHLDGGRIDGLPWDFTRDGLGNTKDVISLLYMQHTSPHNRLATRPDPRECMRTGVTGSHFIVPEPADVDDLLAYVSSLTPEANPNRATPAEAAARGKSLFEGKAGCAGCHPAPYFTDQRMHNVGILSPNEPDGRYDTPSLVEAYRTAPYFHDGRAVTIKEALTTADVNGQHGHARDLTPQEVDDLVAYVLSL